MAKLNNNDSKKIKELIIKVRALAENGDKGERENARLKLKELMGKYRLTKYQENKYKIRTFNLKDFEDCKTIMVHCILDTNHKVEIEGDEKRKELYCKITDEQYIDICEKFNHYYPEFISQRDIFMKAFIIKNDLGIVDGKLDDGETNSVTDIAEMMENVKASSYKNKRKLVASNN